eukprot:259731-Chlamydomonas_euryale.AAC.16
MHDTDRATRAVVGASIGAVSTPLCRAAGLSEVAGWPAAARGVERLEQRAAGLVSSSLSCYMYGWSRSRRPFPPAAINPARQHDNRDNFRRWWRCASCEGAAVRCTVGKPATSGSTTRYMAQLALRFVWELPYLPVACCAGSQSPLGVKVRRGAALPRAREHPDGRHRRPAAPATHAERSRCVRFGPSSTPRRERDAAALRSRPALTCKPAGGLTAEIQPDRRRGQAASAAPQQSTCSSGSGGGGAAAAAGRARARYRGRVTFAQRVTACVTRALLLPLRRADQVRPHGRQLCATARSVLHACLACLRFHARARRVMSWVAIASSRHTPRADPNRGLASRASRRGASHGRSDGCG